MGMQAVCVHMCMSVTCPRGACVHVHDEKERASPLLCTCLCTHNHSCVCVCVPLACTDRFTSTCVSVCTVCSLHVFMDIRMTVGWENLLELVRVSVLLDENIMRLCNYANNATQIIFFFMKISALSETFWPTIWPTSSKKPS